MQKPLMEISRNFNISRFTLAQAAKSGRLGAAATQYGKSWMIDADHPDYQSWFVAHAHQPRVKKGLEMEHPTLLEQTQEIRARYQRGEISPEDAKKLIKPYYDEYCKVAKEKAKTIGLKAPVMTLQKFLSRRSDLRYVAQEQVIRAREEQGE